MEQRSCGLIPSIGGVPRETSVRQLLRLDLLALNNGYLDRIIDSFQSDSESKGLNRYLENE